MDNGVDDEGDGVTDNDGNNSDGATDDDVNEDGDGNGNGATDDDDNDDDDGDDGNGAAADNNDVDDDDDDDNVDNNNLPPRVGVGKSKRNDGCDETKTEEEETITDSVVIHTTIKQITGRGGW